MPPNALSFVTGRLARASVRHATGVRVRLSITQRVTLLWTVLFALGLCAFALAAAAFVQREGGEALDADLAIRAQEALNAVGHGQSVSVVGDAGVVVMRGTQLVQRSGIAPPPGVTTLPANALSHGTAIHGYRAVGLAAAGYRAIAYASDTALIAEAQRIRTGFVIAALPVVVLSALAGWLLARRSLRPVDDITRLASTIAASGTMDGRVSLRSDDELGRLAATFDAMLERLEASFARERAFIGDVSHELRTAVGAMTAIAEVALGHERDPAEYRIALESVVRRGKVLTSVIDDLLLLARADAGVLRTTERAEINDIVAAVGADAQRSSSSIRIDVDLADEAAFVEATGELLARALGNVVANALRHAGGRISLAVERRDGSVIVRVDDDGPGIAVQERDQVLRRFYRGASRYEGTGIGLALSAAVARAYGGDIVVADSPLGGARVAISLPLAR
jgi:signal transduction histidine kinase